MCTFTAPLSAGGTFNKTNGGAEEGGIGNLLVFIQNGLILAPIGSHRCSGEGFLQGLTLFAPTMHHSVVSSQIQLHANAANGGEKSLF